MIICCVLSNFFIRLGEFQNIRTAMTYDSVKLSACELNKPRRWRTLTLEPRISVTFHDFKEWSLCNRSYQYRQLFRERPCNYAVEK